MPPLGLRPVATESSRNLKASNFPITTFTIGNWKVLIYKTFLSIYDFGI